MTHDELDSPVDAEAEELWSESGVVETIPRAIVSPMLNRATVHAETRRKELRASASKRRCFRRRPATIPTKIRNLRRLRLNRLRRSLAVLLVLTAPALYAADVKETIHVVITGGPNAGTYDGSTDRGGCSVGMTGHGSWGNQYSLVKENNPKVLNSVQLIVPDPKSPHNFFLNVAFG